MIEAAIFDLDGTILDSTSMWMQAGERYLQTLGVSPEPNVGKTIFPMSMQEGAEFLKNQYKINLSINQIKLGVNEIMRKSYEEEVVPKDGVITLLQKLHTTNVPMTVATATDRELVESVLKRINILNLFDGIFTCSEVGLNKTSPDIYLQACKFMQTNPNKTWVFEDAIHAAKTVKNAGFLLAGVYDEGSMVHQQQLMALSDIYIESFANVSHLF